MSSTHGLAEIRAELAAAGVYRHHEVAGWLRLAGLIAFIVGCLGALTMLPVWTALILVPLAALATTTAAMLGHEGSHGSFSASKFQNRALAFITFPLLSGMSMLYWKHKHDGAHHGHPNINGVDPDIDLWPMATTREDHERSGPARRWFQRNLQGWAFWPLTGFMVVGMRLSGVKHLIAQYKKKGVDSQWAIDAACVVGHYALWFGLGTWVFGFLPLLAIYTGLWAVVSVALALIFSPAHMGLPVMSSQYPDWLHQLETTRNLRTPRWSSWFFVGLDYQIEHHLFPRIPHQQLPKASRIVQAWCERIGAPHRTIGYQEAVVSVTVTIRDSWNASPMTREDVRAEWAPEVVETRQAA